MGIWAKSRVVVRKLLKSNHVILADQIVCSASNAAAIIFASLFLSVGELGVYTLLQLAATSIITLQRSVFLEPCLSLGSSSAPVRLSLKWALSFYPVVFALGAGALVLLGVEPIFIVLGLCLLIPGLQDLLRYRSFADQKPRRVFLSDAIWLILLVFGFFTSSPSSVWEAVFIWTGSGFISLLLLLSPLGSRGEVGMRAVLLLGRFQVVDWVIATVTSTAPFLIVQAVVPVSSVGAFRLAQTVMGPLNTVNSFVTLRYLLDSNEIKGSSGFVVRQRLALSARRLQLYAAGYGLLACAGMFIFSIFLDEDLSGQLFYALPITALTAILMAPCTPYIAVLRAKSLQKLGIVPRFIVLVAAMLGLMIGFAVQSLANADPLVFAVLCTGIASLLTYQRVVLKVIA